MRMGCFSSKEALSSAPVLGYPLSAVSVNDSASDTSTNCPLREVHVQSWDASALRVAQKLDWLYLIGRNAPESTLARVMEENRREWEVLNDGYSRPFWGDDPEHGEDWFNL